MDRVADAERDYLVAMAQVVAAEDTRRHRPGDTAAVRSGDVAARLQRTVTSVTPTRSTLIARALAYSPRHGYTAFAVPQFDRYLLRTFA